MAMVTFGEVLSSATAWVEERAVEEDGAAQKRFDDRLAALKDHLRLEQERREIARRLATVPAAMIELLGGMAFTYRQERADTDPNASPVEYKLSSASIHPETPQTAPGTKLVTGVVGLEIDGIRLNHGREGEMLFGDAKRMQDSGWGDVQPVSASVWWTYGAPDEVEEYGGLFGRGSDGASTEIKTVPFEPGSPADSALRHQADFVYPPTDDSMSRDSFLRSVIDQARTEIDKMEAVREFAEEVRLLGTNGESVD